MSNVLIKGVNSNNNKDLTTQLLNHLTGPDVKGWSRFIDYVPSMFEEPRLRRAHHHWSLQSFDVCGNINDHLLIRKIYEEQVLNVRE